MRLVPALVLGLAVIGCATAKVQRLDLRDPRLPVEARRWLADAEDEVAIAWARMDDSRATLARLGEYRDQQLGRLDQLETGPAREDGEAAARALGSYAEARVQLGEAELELSEIDLELARTRLDQARAETAVRYDLTVYELQPIISEVELLRDEVAASERRLEEVRAEVEEKAASAWKAYSQYVSKGGTSNALWSAP
jgi:hypothetical protein